MNVCEPNTRTSHTQYGDRLLSLRTLSNSLNNTCYIHDSPRNAERDTQFIFEAGNQNVLRVQGPNSLDGARV